jgi:hypothetical protein
VQVAGDIFQHLVVPGHGDQLGLEAAAEDPRLLVALGAGQRASAQRAVDVDLDEIGISSGGKVNENAFEIFILGGCTEAVTQLCYS